MYSPDEMIKKLTDAYSKEKDSNNYKLFMLLANELKQMSEAEKKTRDTRCINTATGEALDLIGKDLGVERDGLSDDIYRITLKAKEYMNFGTGSYNNSVVLLANALDCDISDIHIVEGYEVSSAMGASIEIDSLPLSVLNNVGMSVEEYEKIIKYVVPAGVAVSSASVEGTFEIGPEAWDESEIEVDESAGFADDEQTTGGILGAAIGGSSNYIRLYVSEPGKIVLDINNKPVEGRYVNGNIIYILEKIAPETFDFYLHNEDKMHIYTATLINGIYNYALKETYDVIYPTYNYVGNYPSTSPYFPPDGFSEYDTFWDYPYFLNDQEVLYIKSTQEDDFEIEVWVDTEAVVYEEGVDIIVGCHEEQYAIMSKNDNKWEVSLSDIVDCFSFDVEIDQVWHSIENMNLYDETLKENYEADGYKITYYSASYYNLEIRR